VGGVGGSGTNSDGGYFVGDGTGAGVRGKGINGVGVVAESDTSSPAHGALKILPQDSDPSSPGGGEINVNSLTSQASLWSSVLGVFNRIVSKVFASTYSSGTTEDTVTGAGTHTFAQTFTIAAGASGKVKQTRRIKIAVQTTSVAGHGTMSVGVYRNNTNIAFITDVTIGASYSGASFFIDIVETIRQLGSGTSGKISSCGVGSATSWAIPEGFLFAGPMVKALLNESVDTTIAHVYAVQVTFENASNVAALNQFIVDISD
jgi:hypothetical protein